MTDEQNDDLTLEQEAMFDRAFKLDRGGDRQMAIEIYEMLARELQGTQHEQYASRRIRR